MHTTKVIKRLDFKDVGHLRFDSNVSGILIHFKIIIIIVLFYLHFLCVWGVCVVAFKVF